MRNLYAKVTWHERWLHGLALACATGLFMNGGITGHGGLTGLMMGLICSLCYIFNPNFKPTFGLVLAALIAVGGTSPTASISLKLGLGLIVFGFGFFAVQGSLNLYEKLHIKAKAGTIMCVYILIYLLSWLLQPAFAQFLVSA